MKKLEDLNQVVYDPLASGLRLILCYIAKHRSAMPDEAVILPVCSDCGRPILNFENANLVYEEDGVSQPIGRAGRYSLIHQPARMAAYHVECDKSDGWWFRLSNVLKSDQRHKWEK